MSVIDYQICLAQETEGAETWHSISSLGGSGVTRERVSCGMDVVTFKVSGQTAFTDNQLFAYKATVRLRKVVDGTPSYWFIGRVATVPRACTGRSESYTMRIEGPWSWFKAATYRQPWAAAGGGVTKPRVILFCDAAGARLTTGAQIIAAAEFARSAGAPIAAVTDVASGFTPPFDEQINLRVSDVITKALAYHPHGVCWFDYSTRTPTFHMKSRLDLASVSRSIAGRADISIAQRTDIQIPALAICYEKTVSVDGETSVQTTLDWAPVIAGESTEDRDARLAEADVVWACYSLQGANVTTVSQLIEAEQFPVNLNDSTWWRARCPSLDEYAAGDMSIANAARLGDSSLSNILTLGVPQPWMTLTVEKERIRADLTYIKRAVVGGVSTIVDQGKRSITLELNVCGASVGQTVYRAPVSIDEGEPVPSGIAAQLYAEWSQLHHEGSVTFSDDDPPGDIGPGVSLNLTGGRSEWETMKAMVVRVSEDVDRGSTTVEFGVPGWTDVDSRVAFARATRERNEAASRVWRTGFTETGVTGPNALGVLRDAGVQASFVRQVFAATGSVAHQVIIDPNLVSKSEDGTTASLLQPREMYVPYVDTGDNNRVKARLAQVLGSALYGTSIDLGSTPGIPSAWDALPSFWGEFSAASGGGSAPTTNFWVASGVSGHSGHGLKLILTTRQYIDNSQATPNLYSEQVMLQFAVDGRLLAVSSVYAYTISPTTAV